MFEEPDNWRDRAACARLPLHVSDRMFFGRGGGPGAAKMICANCPVRRQCLDFALTANNALVPGDPGAPGVWFGVYGGRTAAERIAISGAA